VFATIALTLSFGAAGAQGAVKNVSLENLRVGFVNSTTNNLFRVGCWTPVWVQLQGGDERFTGLMEIEVPDDTGTPALFRQVVDIGPNESQRLVTYARPGTRDPNFWIRLYDQRGRRRLSVDGAAFLASGTARSPDGSSTGIKELSPIQADETLVLTLGKPSGVDLVPAMPGFTTDTTISGRALSVARVEATEGLVPGRWYGYDAAEAVVLDTNDKDAMESLNIRGQALVDWVARGGHLVIAVGGNWQAVHDSVLEPILPAAPTGQIKVNTLGAIDTFAGSTNKSITPPGSSAVVVTKLEEIDARRGKILSASGNIPLVVRGTHGFGRVTLVGLDVDQKPFADWPDRAQFWYKAIDLRTAGADASTNATPIGGGRRFFVQGTNDVSGLLHRALEQFPGVKLVPFGWVAFFIFLYILLIGPGDYLLLKKVIKRMELTWITFPAIVLSVSLLAYIAAYAVKGRDLRVNKVDVLDVDQTSGMARGMSIINIFSPQNRDYDVSVLPLAMDRPVPAPAKNGQPPRAAGSEVLMSWLGTPDSQFGGMGGTGRMGFSSGGYASAPIGSSERLENLRVAIWSTKYLNARWFGSSPALAEADIQPAGTDRLTGTVTNRLSVPMEDAILAYGKHVYLLGKIEPNATIRVELTKDRQLSGLLNENSKKYLEGAQLSPEDRLKRPELVLSVMFHDSRDPASEGPKANTVLRNLDLTGLLALGRPMLVAQVNRPAAELVLENAGVDPKIEQTTMLRIMLPLNTPTTEARPK
jgi:hypothetical protein